MNVHQNGISKRQWSTIPLILALLGLSGLLNGAWAQDDLLNWSFTDPDDYAEWTTNVPRMMSDYGMEVDLNTTDSFINIAEAFEASKFNTLQLQLALGEVKLARLAKVQWDNGSGFSDANSIDFHYDGFGTMIIEMRMGNHPNWTGSISELRIDPSDKIETMTVKGAALLKRAPDEEFESNTLRQLAIPIPDKVDWLQPQKASDRLNYTMRPILVYVFSLKDEVSKRINQNVLDSTPFRAMAVKFDCMRFLPSQRSKYEKYTGAVSQVPSFIFLYRYQSDGELVEVQRAAGNLSAAQIGREMEIVLQKIEVEKMKLEAIKAGEYYE
ncbi:hypothetical protein JXA32_14320 [Candidatus Sumerlaeota bacterium]|nr:hypothetical protein [Candidatus Sumerlaeota bacterium]